ncbi:alpha/beta fold hydrolase [Nocardia sp. NPDC060256]|uniref:alpha/beta fold hydrolase n=1 Tax=unclassified Nocardia TaxID=2637762 RepID=UPI003653AAE3
MPYDNRAIGLQPATTNEATNLAAQVALVLVHGIRSGEDAWEPLMKLIEGDPDLADRVRVINFDYPSRILEPDPRRRVPDFNTVAEYLGTIIAEEIPADQPIIFAAHSQGGLIVQRYLAQQLDAGKGIELQRVRRVLMFATPNSGSEFALTWRRLLGRLIRNDQELELRPIAEQILETQQVIVNRVVNATETSANSVPIPIEAYAGASDNIVKRASARFVFREGGTLEGDHSTIIRPDSRESRVYQILKSRLLHDASRSGTADSGAATMEPVEPDEFSAERRAAELDISRDELLTDAAVRKIALALSEIDDLQQVLGRQNFVRMMPKYIRQYAEVGVGINPKLDLGGLVRVCGRFGSDGREALIEGVIAWFEPEDVAVKLALTTIEQEWPQNRPTSSSKAGGDNHPK